MTERNSINRKISIAEAGWDFKRYRKYIWSDKWKEKRERRLLFADDKCEECGAKATVVHHTTYERLGDEWLEDLLALCKFCHRKYHPRPWLDQNAVVVSRYPKRT